VKALLLALPVAALVACGSSSSGGPAAGTASSTSTSSSSTATAAPATAAPTAAPGVAVGTGTAGSAGTVLVDAQGHTLYRFTPEAQGTISCTGGCATTWPPLTVPAGQKIAAQGSLSGTFTTVQRPDGTMQAAYNGWPLYDYSGDTAAGTAAGQGIGGKWFAVTPTQAAAGM
jgi:predicted lipoprotein with Yx(FWY)xxD motif